MRQTTHEERGKFNAIKEELAVEKSRCLGRELRTTACSNLSCHCESPMQADMLHRHVVLSTPLNDHRDRVRTSYFGQQIRIGKTTVLQLVYHPLSEI